MGGFMFIIGIFLACAICIPMMYILAPENSNELILRNQTLTKAVGGLLMALGFGAIGFLDDYIKVVKKRNLGLNEKQKLILQFLVTAAYLAALYLSGVRGVTKIPFLGACGFGDLLLDPLLPGNCRDRQCRQFYRWFRRTQASVTSGWLWPLC